MAQLTHSLTPQMFRHFPVHYLHERYTKNKAIDLNTGWPNKNVLFNSLLSFKLLIYGTIYCTCSCFDEHLLIGPPCACTSGQSDKLKF